MESAPGKSSPPVSPNDGYQVAKRRKKANRGSKGNKDLDTTTGKEVKGGNGNLLKPAGGEKSGGKRNSGKQGNKQVDAAKKELQKITK